MAHRTGIHIQPVGHLAEGVHGSRTMGMGCRPTQAQCGNVLPRDDTPDGVEDRQAVGMPKVQALDVSIEVVAQALQAVGLRAPGVRVDVALRVPGLVQLGQHIQLAGLAGMQLEAELTQIRLAQAPVDDVERGNLLRHEQHPLALGQTLRDQIADGLALAGARRADEHEVFATHSGHHRGQL